MIQTGIVLKKTKPPYKIALLDKDAGHYDAFMYKEIAVGSLIEYIVERERNNTIFLAQCNVIKMPFLVACDDILFLHHIFELCYFFVPVASHTEQLFELLTFLYTVDTGALQIQTKKLFIVQLLTCIGLYSRLPNVSPAVVQALSKPPFQHDLHQLLSDEDEKKVDEWLRVCVAEHPAVGRFKTIHFLNAR